MQRDGAVRYMGAPRPVPLLRRARQAQINLGLYSSVGAIFKVPESWVGRGIGFRVRYEITTSMPRQLLFELNDARVTPHIATFGGTSYQIATIGSESPPMPRIRPSGAKKIARKPERV
jgi:hypothetical protein